MASVEIAEVFPDTMDQYREVVDAAIEELELFDEKREEVIRLTRKLNRASGRGISKIVREESYDNYLTDARQTYKQLVPLMKQIEAVTSWGISNSGTEEYAEFELLHSIIIEKPLPSPQELELPSWIWIAGLGDVIGELRRFMLSQLIQQDYDRAKQILTRIQDLYDTIVGLEFSKAVVSNLRRKIDVARSLVDRCESDFANAVINKQSKGSS